MYSVKFPGSFGTQNQSYQVRVGTRYGMDAPSLPSILDCNCVELLIKYSGLLLGAKHKDFIDLGYDG